MLPKLTQRSGFVYLGRRVPDRQAQAILALNVPGIAGTAVMRRVYPRGTLAAQVLGLVGTEGGGLTGLEYSRNAILAGRPGQRRVVSDALGQPVSISEVHQEVPGESLTLSLDANIQQRAEDVLDAVGRVFSPKDATAIVMDPRSGAVLAMADWPQVNANEPAGSPPQALENRAVSFDYEPGSTFKARDGFRRPAERASSPRNRLQHPRPDQGRRQDDPRRHRTRRRDAHRIADPRPVQQRGRDQDRMAEGAPRFNEWVRRFGFGARRASSCRARKSARC